MAELFAGIGGVRLAFEAETVPNFDVLTAGFPCQPFSVAGKRRGLDDVLGTLFFEVARLFDAKRPAAYFLENVPSLARQDHGRTFAIIRRCLEEHLGYSFHAKVVRACDFGLPQLPPRLFMCGFRRSATPFVWPEPSGLQFTLGELLGGETERDIVRTVLARHRGLKPGAPFCWDAYEVDEQGRRLTLHDVLARQGFPPDFVLPTAVSHAFKQLGTAVAVPAIEAVARAVLDSLPFTEPPVVVPAISRVRGGEAGS